MTSSTSQYLSKEQIKSLAWRTSTRSQSAGPQCVEIAPLEDGTGRVAVRHSQHPDEALLVYTQSEWDAFLHGAKNGEFDF